MPKIYLMVFFSCLVLLVIFLMQREDAYYKARTVFEKKAGSL